MSRLEKYKRLRNLKQRYFLSALLFLFLLVTGVCIADFSTNELMEGVAGLNIFSVKSYDDSVQIAFMNGKIYLNTQYIKRDLENIKHNADRLLGLK